MLHPTTALKLVLIGAKLEASVGPENTSDILNNLLDALDGDNGGDEGEYVAQFYMKVNEQGLRIFTVITSPTKVQLQDPKSFLPFYNAIIEAYETNKTRN